ncbi:adenylate cyclase type 1-like [Tachysurus ichikawai]
MNGPCPGYLCVYGGRRGPELRAEYADDTTVVGQISNIDESAFREKIQSLLALCSTNNLTLSATKTKDLVVDVRKSNNSRHTSTYINGTEEVFLVPSSWASTSLGIRTL